MKKIQLVLFLSLTLFPFFTIAQSEHRYNGSMTLTTATLNEGFRLKNEDDLTIAKFGRDYDKSGFLSLYDASSNTKVLFAAKQYEKSFVNNGGNVGIGTSNPVAKLTVKTGIDWDGVHLINENDKLVAKMGRTSNGSGYFAAYNASSKRKINISAQDSEPNYFNCGNMGIGTDHPEAMLHVKGLGGVVAENEGVKVLVGHLAAFAGGWIGTKSKHGLTLGTNNVGDNMYLDTDNNVFIGAGRVSIGSASKEKYNLFVSKGILTEDIAIGAKKDWADYVFSKNYRLKSLEEVSEFIDKNHHLPNMPSQELVAKEGYNMHDMNVKFLVKLEELTSYTIQQENKIKELTTQLDEINALQGELRLLLNDLTVK